MILGKEIQDWARSRKRVTNREIRERFDVDEDTADGIYKTLKNLGIVGTMGHVIKEGE